jgi:peptidoglycan LD-endopeptidase LytH
MSRNLRILVLLVVLVVAGVYSYRAFRPTSLRSAQLFAWMRAPASAPNLPIAAGTRCGEAPFIFPTTGVPGFLWDDSFRIGHRHQGVDIFAGTDVNVTEVIAVSYGFLTRLPEWKSSVILRIPTDPLQPGRQIWVYYTHMADPQGNSFISPDLPPGTYDKPVEAGTFLGRQGDYSGDPNNPVGVHLHISIVKDDAGKFTNELDINNTYDPSPYFGLALNGRKNPDKIPVCDPAATDP